MISFEKMNSLLFLYLHLNVQLLVCKIKAILVLYTSFLLLIGGYIPLSPYFLKITVLKLKLTNRHDILTYNIAL